MSLEEVKQILEQIEERNTVRRNQSISYELENYSEDFSSMDESVDYWREIEEVSSQTRYLD